MSKLEVACVIIGFIAILFNTTTESEIKSYNRNTIIVVHILDIIKSLIFMTMIILPLYFNYWRK